MAVVTPAPRSAATRSGAQEDPRTPNAGRSAAEAPIDPTTVIRATTRHTATTPAPANHHRVRTTHPLSETGGTSCPAATAASRAGRSTCQTVVSPLDGPWAV